GVIDAYRPSLDGNELGDGRAQGVELLLHELIRDLRLDRAYLERSPIGELGPRWHRECRAELPVLVVRGRQLELILRLCDRPHAGPCRGVPEPAPDVTLDRLRHQTLL